MYVSILVPSDRLPPLHLSTLDHLSFVEMEKTWRIATDCLFWCCYCRSILDNIQRLSRSNIFSICPVSTFEFIIQSLTLKFCVYRELNDIAENFYFVNVYMKTHMRAGSYCIGLFFGYLVHKIQSDG